VSASAPLSGLLTHIYFDLLPPGESVIYTYTGHLPNSVVVSSARHNMYLSLEADGGSVVKAEDRLVRINIRPPVLPGAGAAHHRTRGEVVQLVQVDFVEPRARIPVRVRPHAARQMRVPLLPPPESSPRVPFP
jgi:hypothetical protein